MYIILFLLLKHLDLQKRMEDEMKKLQEKISKTQESLAGIAPKYDEMRQREETAAAQ